MASEKEGERSRKQQKAIFVKGLSAISLCSKHFRKGVFNFCFLTCIQCLAQISPDVTFFL